MLHITQTKQIRKQDAQTFKYMPEATINTSRFSCVGVFFFFFAGGVGREEGGSKLKSDEKCPWGIF